MKQLSFFERLGLVVHIGISTSKVLIQVMYGAWRMSILPRPIISIFGGSRLKHENKYFAMAHELALRSVQRDISVITGGGPGIMEAANCGATHRKDKKLMSMGVRVKGLEKPDEHLVNLPSITLDYFFARKWLLTRYSLAFVVFPGGLGTVDEFAEVMTLIQTKKMPHLPVILIGVEYWKPFMVWVHESAVKNNLIAADEARLFSLTDDLDEAFVMVCTACDKRS